MRWRKLGQIFVPAGESDWMASHAANPTGVSLGNNAVRIYFSTRDAGNRSSIGWVELEMIPVPRVVRVATEPVLRPGQIGCFDDSGCSIGSIVPHDGKWLLYYMGWNLGVTVPWRNAVGLASSTDEGLSFDRVSVAPIMDRSEEDPFTLSYPCVLRHSDGWRMWYGSNLRWGVTQADMFHMIKAATSADGVRWARDGRVVVEPADERQYAFARPCVVRDADRWRMWYSWRGETYSIGYAESADGNVWIRKDEESGIGLSSSGWDSEMIEYPFVFDHDGQRYMLFNGNGYGKTGFGIAILET